MGFPYSKVLCPIDFDANSLTALDEAIKIARHFKAAIFLVHVVPLIVPFGEVPIPPELYEKQLKDAKAQMAKIAGEKLGGIDHQSFVYTGDVAASIIQAVEKYRPDIVIMATHRRGALAHLFLGSVAGDVVRKAPCPVMTIRNPATEAAS
jgi:nucleotide-binding universal stress UspA family protein